MFYYLVSYLDIIRNIFQVSPVDCWDQCYTDGKVLHVGWDGILVAAQGKIRCLPCCSWPCPMCPWLGFRGGSMATKGRNTFPIVPLQGVQ